MELGAWNFQDQLIHHSHDDEHQDRQHGHLQGYQQGHHLHPQGHQHPLPPTESNISQLSIMLGTWNFQDKLIHHSHHCEQQHGQHQHRHGHQQGHHQHPHGHQHDQSIISQLSIMVGTWNLQNQLIHENHHDAHQPEQHRYHPGQQQGHHQHQNGHPQW